jgi:hypothetical protein
MHSVAITRQMDRPIPEWLEGSAKKTGGRIVVMDYSLSPVDRVQRLNEVVNELAEIVILHIDPDDPIPIAALSSHINKNPILFFNHADHVFSLGASISTVTMDFRESGLRITQMGRGRTTGCALVPIPLSDTLEERAFGVDARESLRAEYRKRLGIPLDCLLCVTVGSEYKYKPALGVSFFDAATRLLERQDKSVICAIGSYDTGIWEEWAKRIGKRFVPLYSIDDATLREYMIAADLYLEGFPFSSLTAMLEAGLCGLAIQRFRNPEAPILSGDDIALDSFPNVATTVDEFVKMASQYLELPRSERDAYGLEVRRRIIEEHCNGEWVSKYLDPLLDKASNSEILELTGGRICSEDAEMSLWSDLQNEWLALLQDDGEKRPQVVLRSLRYCPEIPVRLKCSLFMYALAEGELSISYRGIAGLVLAAMDLASLGLSRSNFKR